MKRISYNTTEILKGVSILIYTAVVLFIIAGITHFIQSVYVSVASSIITVLFLTSSYLIFIKLRRFDKGVDGEEAVLKILKQLPEGYTFLHDVVLDNYGNIDFVVIGPTGIWAIEVKNHKDTAIIKDSFLLDDLKQPKGNAAKINEFLFKTLRNNIYVQPVMVYANKKTRLNFGWHKQDGVYVIGINFLPELTLQRSQTSLSYEQCFTITNNLKKYTSII